MELAAKENIQVKEEEFSLDFLREADEVFITGTSVEVMPIHTLDDKELPEAHPITDKLVTAYENLYKVKI